MIVILNSGVKVKVDKQFARSIFKGLLFGPVKENQFVCQLDGRSDKLGAFNLSHVAAICDEEDIIRSKEDLDSL